MVFGLKTIINYSVERMKKMNLIACVDECVYQLDGYCHLDKVTVISGDSSVSGCVYFKNVRNNDCGAVDKDINIIKIDN